MHQPTTCLSTRKPTNESTNERTKSIDPLLFDSIESTGEIGDEHMGDSEGDEDSVPATHQLALLRVCSLMLNKMIIKGCVWCCGCASCSSGD
jgi:hypothetical protein